MIFFKADIDKAVAAAKLAFARGSAWRNLDASGRGILLLKVKHQKFSLISAEDKKLIIKVLNISSYHFIFLLQSHVSFSDN